MNRPITAPVSLIALALAAAPRPAVADVQIERKFASGATCYHEVHISLKQKVTGPMFPGEGMTFDLDQTYGVIEKVESVSKDETRVSLTFDRVKQRMLSSMMGDEAMTYDTDVPDDEDADDGLRTIADQMLGHKLAYTLDGGRKVKSFKGMDELAAKIRKKAMASGAWMMMQREFTDDRARQKWVEQPMALYANRKVKVGDTWKTTLETKDHEIGSYVTEYECKLARISRENGREIPVVSYRARLKSVESKDKPARSKFSGEVTGQAVYDADRGVFVTRTDEGTINIEMTVPGMAGRPDDDEDADPDDEDEADPGSHEGDNDDDAKEFQKAPPTMRIEIRIQSQSTCLPTADREKQKAAAKAKATKDKPEKKPAPDEDDD